VTAQLQRQALDLVSGLLHQQPTDSRGARETDLADALVGKKDGSDFRWLARHQIGDTRRQLSIVQALENCHRCQRCSVVGFGNDGATRRQRGGDFARQQVGGEVPRCDGRHDADRLADNPVALLRDELGHDVAVVALRFFGIPLKVIRCHPHFHPRLFDGLSDFQRHQASDFFRPLADQIGGSFKVTGALVRCQA
jgi:hypothetical protein